MSSKELQLQLHDFLEHLITCSTNSTKFSRAVAILNRAKTDGCFCVLPPRDKENSLHRCWLDGWTI
jgi:hypothetical protein